MIVLKFILAVLLSLVGVVHGGTGHKGKVFKIPSLLKLLRLDRLYRKLKRGYSKAPRKGRRPVVIGEEDPEIDDPNSRTTSAELVLKQDFFNQVLQNPLTDSMYSFR
jgi:hypothetical protein